MILTCNECEWSFKTNACLIKDAGSNVRCSKCGNIWRVYPAVPEEEILVLEPEQSEDDIMLDEAAGPAPIDEIELEIEENKKE